MDARLRKAGGGLLQRGLEPGARFHAVELARCDQRSDASTSVCVLVWPAISAFAAVSLTGRIRFPCACFKPIVEPALHASRVRLTPFTLRAIGPPTGRTRRVPGRFGQGRSIGIRRSVARANTCAVHAQMYEIPPEWSLLVGQDVNRLIRQPCARMRAAQTGPATDLLPVAIAPRGPCRRGRDRPRPPSRRRCGEGRGHPRTGSSAPSGARDSPSRGGSAPSGGGSGW